MKERRKRASEGVDIREWQPQRRKNGVEGGVRKRTKTIRAGQGR